MATVTGTKSHAWPPEAHADRLRLYQRYRHVYEGEHERVFTKAPYRFRYDSSRDYVAANLCGTLTDLLVSRSVGGGITLDLPDDAAGSEAWLKQLIARSRLETQLIAFAVDCSVTGDAVFAARFDAESGTVQARTVDPATYFPEQSDVDATQRIAATIGTVIPVDEHRAYLWLERNEMREDGYGWIVNTLYRLTVDRTSNTPAYTYDPEDDLVPLDSIPQTADLPEEQNTGITRLLTVHVGNRTNKPGALGASDYKGLMYIQGEVNNRLTQRAEVLDKFVDPIMYGPDISDERGKVALSEDKYVITEMGGEGAPVGMIVWDAQLSAVKDELTELRELFAVTAGIELTALVPQAGGGPQSGRAIRLSQTRTQATVAARQRQYEMAVQELLALALELAVVSGVKGAPEDGQIAQVQPEDIAVGLGDGLPQDTLGEIEEQVSMLEAGVQSRVEAVMALHGLTRDAAEQMVSEIDAERNTATHNLGGLLGLNGIGTQPPTMQPVPGEA